MKHMLIPAVLALVMVLPAYAQTAEDQLNQCLADSTSGKDRKELARWVVAAMAQHPAMTDISNVSPNKLDAINKATANLYNRLLLVDCVEHVKASMKSGGEQAINKSFEFLGKLAMQELMTNPKVTQAISGLEKYADYQKLHSVLGTR